VVAAIAFTAAPAPAYIGPVAGFAVRGAFPVVIATLVLAAFTLARWPLKVAPGSESGSRRRWRRYSED